VLPVKRKMNFFIKLLITAGISYLLPQLLSGIHVDSFKAAVLFALLLGILNVLVKPIFIILTLPATILTLGLFLLVINAVLVMLSAKFISGFHVDGFWWALLFSICLSLITSFLHSVIDNPRK